MKLILSITGKTIALIALTIAFSCIGIGSDQPEVMMPICGAMFLIIVAAMFFYQSLNKRRSFTQVKTPTFVPITAGALLMIFAICFPAISFANFRPNLADTIGTAVMLPFTLMLLALGMAGVYAINILGKKNIIPQILGYIVIIITLAIPALVIAPIDASFGTLGVIYFTTMIEVIIAWAGFHLIYSNIKK